MMKTSELLLRAAKLVHKTAKLGTWEALGCCDAIWTVNDRHTAFIAREYFWTLRPKQRMRESEFWWTTPEHQTPDDVNQRVLALLFARAMAESDGD